MHILDNSRCVVGGDHPMRILLAMLPHRLAKITRD
ncbi:Uncharacterised protein [Vibrio cholerae]|nr:Uncharacterised protein [Vibrio cholerae]CSI77752.1 Uncharacterised protein [Vibrio cholerae]